MRSSAREAVEHHKHILKYYGIRKAPGELLGPEIDPAPDLPPGAAPDPSAPLEDRLAACEEELDRFERFFVSTPTGGLLWITIQDEDEVAEKILTRHFQRAEYYAGGTDGLASFVLEGNDGTVFEDTVSQGRVNDSRRLRYLHEARWVEVADDSIYVWHGGDRIMVHLIDRLFCYSMGLKPGESGLEDVRRAIAGEIERKAKGIPLKNVKVRWVEP